MEIMIINSSFVINALAVARYLLILQILGFDLCMVHLSLLINNAV